MNILIIGGAGFLGQKLAYQLAQRGQLRGQSIARLILADIQPPTVPKAPFPVASIACDIANPADVAQAMPADVDVIFLLAAIVSAHAEQDFDAGLAINLMGVLNVLQQARALARCPVVVFTSSIAAYGGEVPDPIFDHSFLNPQTSYGTQKAMGELLINDFSRKGFVDGRGLRLPTITVRPGAPNRAASGFMSGIFREPLAGVPANCPVAPDYRHYYLSPRKCVENLVKGAELPSEALGQNRCMMMPGRDWSIAQMIAAMTAVAGPKPAQLISWQPQPEVQAIVGGWRHDIRPQKALALGLEADDSFEDNIRHYLADDAPQP